MAKAKSRKSKRAKLQGSGVKKGLDLSPEEAHRLWSVALSGKEFGAVAYVYGIHNTAVAVGNPSNERPQDIDSENKKRREVISKFLRSWADNIEGKA